MHDRQNEGVLKAGVGYVQHRVGIKDEKSHLPLAQEAACATMTPALLLGHSGVGVGITRDTTL